jgi:hypothetical protein
VGLATSLAAPGSCRDKSFLYARGDHLARDQEVPSTSRQRALVYRKGSYVTATFSHRALSMPLMRAIQRID